MAHQVETMAYAGELPWHGLGVKVSNELTPAMMMEKAGLDWTVEKKELKVIDGMKSITIPGRKALIRSSDEKFLDIVGDEWHPIQNADVFDFFTEFVMAGDMEMHTAGSLKGGSIIWALAKVKESFDVFGDDRVDAYMLLSSPPQYGKSMDVRFTPIRVVCNNTLTMSLQAEAKRSVRVGHRTAFDPDSVKETLGIAHEKFAKYKDMAQFLGSKKFSVDALVKYYNELFPTTSKKEEEKVKAVNGYDDMSRAAKMCYDALEVQPGAEYAPGTWWQALNSGTYITDHHQGRNAENRLHSQWFGFNQGRKVRAAEKAVEFARAS